MSYESPSCKLSASGQAVTAKKTARKLAAARLIADLIESTDPTGTSAAVGITDEETSTGDTWIQRVESVAEASEQPSARTDACRTDDVDLNRSGAATVSDIATDDTWTEQHEDVAETSEQSSASTDGRCRMGVGLDRSEESSIEIDTNIVDPDLMVQWNLERAARGVLLHVQERHGLRAAVTAHENPLPPLGVLSAATDFVNQTNAALKECFRRDPTNRRWVCTLLYKSPLRKISSFGEPARGKNVARKLAAARLIADLLMVMPA